MIGQFLSDPKAIWYLMRATGVVVVALLSLSVTLGVLSTARVGTRWWPQFATQHVHRTVSMLAVTLLVGHVVAAVVHTFVNIAWIDVLLPFVSAYRPFWVGLGALAVDLLAVVVVTSLLRHRLGRRSWRAVHLTTYAAWAIGLIHGLGIGTDATAPWAASVYIISCAMVGSALVLRQATRRADAVHGHGPAPMPSRVVHVSRRSGNHPTATRRLTHQDAQEIAQQRTRRPSGLPSAAVTAVDEQDSLGFWQEVGS